MSIEPFVVNRLLQVCTMPSGEHLPITNWFDSEGEDCEPLDAIVVVCGPDNEGGWHVVDTRLLEPVTEH